MKYNRDRYELMHLYPSQLKVGDYIVGENRDYSEIIMNIDFIEDDTEDKIWKEVDRHNRRPRYNLHVDYKSENVKEYNEPEIARGYIMDILPDEITTILRFSLRDVLKKL